MQWALGKSRCHRNMRLHGGYAGKTSIYNSHFTVKVYEVTLYLSYFDLDEHRDDLICGSAGKKLHTV